MKHPGGGDTQIIAVVEQSVLVARLERFARKIVDFWETSRARTAAARLRTSVTGRPGFVLLTAAITHVVLVAAVARPADGYWLILPGVGATAGGILVWTAHCASNPRD